MNHTLREKEENLIRTEYLTITNIYGNGPSQIAQKDYKVQRILMNVMILLTNTIVSCSHTNKRNCLLLILPHVDMTWHINKTIIPMIRGAFAVTTKLSRGF